MNSSIQNELTNEDIFILDRDQSDQQRQRPNTSLPNCNVINPPRTTTTYEITRTADLHVVLVHEQQPITIINKENNHDVIRRFTHDNMVKPEDVFLSTIDSSSGSKGYSGSDWDTDSP